jgi:geranylgeranyl pyrophosphate synthase
MSTAEASDDQIAEVIEAVRDAGGFDYARGRALRLAEQADGELDALSPSPARDALRASITYVVDRRQ